MLLHHLCFAIVEVELLSIIGIQKPTFSVMGMIDEIEEISGSTKHMESLLTVTFTTTTNLGDNNANSSSQLMVALQDNNDKTRTSLTEHMEPLQIVTFTTTFNLGDNNVNSSSQLMVALQDNNDMAETSLTEHMEPLQTVNFTTTSNLGDNNANSSSQLMVAVQDNNDPPSSKNPFEPINDRNIVPSLSEHLYGTPTHNLNRKQFIPHCEKNLIPVLHMTFDSLEEGVKFYETYAKACAFDIRSGSKKVYKGVVTSKYYLCNKQGMREEKLGALRRRLVTRKDCSAKIVFQRTKKGKYWVFKFIEAHSHILASPNSRQHLKWSSSLNNGQKRYIMNNLNLNKGPTSSYKMWKEQVGSYLKVGASLDNFKNFYRDLKCIINESNGQMFVEMFVDDTKSLSKAIWADGISRRNYSLFGDSISVDATYGTNKYNQIFVPFTGVDHQKKCVTFAVGLISKEDVSSYTWLFESFLRAMGGKQPDSIITDQDPAIKIALPNVFDKSIHKFCCWHIMKKLTDKVSIELRNDDEFLRRINKLVYNRDNEPHEFEDQWSKMMSDYEHDNLRNNDWFNSMYDIREMWVPEYFRDLYMGGLLITTSRSETENNFFNYFTLDSKCKLYSAPLKTRIPLEKHASSAYTDVVFKDFQEQILSARVECGFEKNLVRDGKDVYNVVHFNIGKIFEVVYDAQTLYVDYSYASKTPVYDIDGTLLYGNNAIEPKKGVLGDVWNEVHRCISLAEDDEDDLQKKNRRVEKTKRQELEKFVGCEAPKTITIQNPKQSSNKGKRKEKDPKQKDTEDEEEQRVTKQRQCKTCGKVAGDLFIKYSGKRLNPCFRRTIIFGIV
ncbi:protein FAR1-RELATED SEQUENCE 5-like [Amaranthus tricolor]|uniref:protein FAR1-RELATED SEQUENCE 5-like n=1 Tax=Amaranthus tricolor TaxID=29722 RepID=UPI002584D1C6|nr:protein FAR1-RELATED SEQUENCE 5-like [Amaranthus tricolor]